jgi:hypothetical protein
MGTRKKVKEGTKNKIELENKNIMLEKLNEII